MSKIIAEIAIPISFALNTEFDYLVPQSLKSSIQVGSRVLVPFRSTMRVGYVLGFKKHSAYERKLKSVLRSLDPFPFIDKKLFRLAEWIHDRYFCSLADAIETVLPSGLKRIKKAFFQVQNVPQAEMPHCLLSKEESALLTKAELQMQLILIHDLSNEKRWCLYSAMIKRALGIGKSVIFLVPDHRKIKRALDSLKIDIKPYVFGSEMKPQQIFDSWVGIKRSDSSFVIGTRSAVFAPVNNLGLIILEEEEHFAYRQDQVPHYRASDVAIQRASDSGAQVVLGSFTPSLDAYALSKSPRSGFLKFEQNGSKAQVHIIDMRQEYVFRRRERMISEILEHRIADVLQRKEKLLIFVNRKGFSNFLYCSKCKTIQACPRCSSSLIYYFKERFVRCPCCAFKSTPLDLCPVCQSSYVKYLGFGLQRVESEILRLFPNVRIMTYERQQAKTETYDIMLATQQFLEDPYWHGYDFDTVCVLACEQILGHVDFRTTERAFSKLIKLLSLAKKEMLIQTQLTEHYVLKYIAPLNVDGFLNQEFRIREELSLPPVKPMAVLQVRSKNQKNLYDAALGFYKRLKKTLKGKRFFEIFEPIPSIPFKIRGNYRYQILIKYKNLKRLKNTLQSIIQERRQGIIVTFDPSPA